MADNFFKVRKGLIVNGSGSTIFDIQGSQGQLFSVTDQLSGSLFTVNDISGIPIMEVFSDDTVKLGTFNDEAIIVDGNTATINNLDVTGNLNGDGSSLTNVDADTLDGQQLTSVRQKVFSTAINNGQDLNSLSDGWYNWTNSLPSNAPFSYAVLLQASDASQKNQLAFGSSGTGKLAVRRADSGTFYDWANFWNEDNDGAGSGLDADLLDGQQGSYYRNASNLNAGTISDARLPSTISSNITGNAATATTWQTARTLTIGGTGKSVNGSSNVTWTTTEIGITKANIDALNIDADTLDGQNGSYYLNYNNFTNTPSIPTVNNDTITISAGNALTGGGNFTLNQSFNETITINHQDTSTQSSVNNSGGTVIQDISLDTYGHTTNINSVDLDTRYLTDENDTLQSVTDRGNTTTNSITVDNGTFNGNVGIGTTSTSEKLEVNGKIVIGDAFSPTAAVRENILNIIVGSNSNGSSNGIAFYENTSGFGMKLGYNGIGSGALNNMQIYDDGDNPLLTFENGGDVGIGTTSPNNKLDVNGGIDANTLNTGQGDNELYEMDQDVKTTDDVTFNTITGNGSNLTNIDADTLDGQQGSYYLDYNNFTSTPPIPTVNNNTITISAGGALTGGGNFTLNQSFNETITINHQDTSTQSSVNNSGGTVIQDISLDTYGHTTNINSVDLDTRYNNYTHPTFNGDDINIDTGALTGATVISDLDFNITTNTEGHVTDANGVISTRNITLSDLGYTGPTNPDNYQYWNLKTNGTQRKQIQSTNDLDIVAGNNVSVGYSAGGVVTINSTDTNTIPNNATITISAGSSLTGGGNFTTDQSFNENITINHGDTSTLSGTYGSTADDIKIDNITVDSNGHVTSITTGNTGDITGVTAGNGLTGGGSAGTITLNHQDTSTQGSVNNSGGTVIQDISLDNYGHTTNINSVDLDTRYLQSEADTLDSVTSRGNETSSDIEIISTSSSNDGFVKRVPFQSSAGGWRRRILSIFGGESQIDAGGILIRGSNDSVNFASISGTTNDSGFAWNTQNAFKIGFGSSTSDFLGQGTLNVENGIYSSNASLGTTNTSQTLNIVGRININDGGNSVFVGQGAGLNDDASINRNVGVGYDALENNTTGYFNTASGYEALRYNTTGLRNTASGYQALRENTTSNNNTASGYQALRENTTGNNNTANGYYALQSNTTGRSNTAIGTFAGAFTVSFSPNQTSNDSVFLGYRTRSNADGQTNQIVIGYSAVGLGSNTAVLGNNNINTTILRGNVGIGTTNPTRNLDVDGNVGADVYYDRNNSSYFFHGDSTGDSIRVAGDVVAFYSSDLRYKDNIKPIEKPIEKLNKIGGYSFNWNERSHKETGKKDIGVVAQEIEKVLPELVDTRSNGYKAVDYPKLTALLIQGMKEQQQQIEELKNLIK